jgi:acyl-CoA thioester hydrolase
MTFLKQLRHPGDIECRVYAGKLGRTSFETWTEIIRTDLPDVIWAEGGAKVVWCDLRRRSRSRCRTKSVA